MCKNELLARIARLECILGCYVPAVDAAIADLRASGQDRSSKIADDLSFIQTDAKHVLNVTPIQEPSQ